MARSSVDKSWLASCRSVAAICAGVAMMTASNGYDSSPAETIQPFSCGRRDCTGRLRCKADGESRATRLSTINCIPSFKEVNDGRAEFDAVLARAAIMARLRLPYLASIFKKRGRTARMLRWDALPP